MKKVLITGTSSGLGRATAERYLSSGYKVYGIDRNGRTLSHRNYRHYVADVRDMKSLPKLSGMNTVINNAGVADDSASIAVNLEGYINVIEAYCFQENIEALINIGSLSARAGLESIRYCASQGGRVSLTKWCAKHLGEKYGACCNCISLGAVRTGFEPELYADKELYRQVADENLLKRWIEPKEIAEWIYFVAEINKAMTGQEILIDCGEEANYNFISAE